MRYRFFFYWLPPIAWMSLIFFLSSVPGLPDFGGFDFSVKKGAHFLVYAFLYFLLFRAFHSAQPDRPVPIPTYVYPAIVAVLFAVSDEVHQTFVPMREGKIRDVLIDSAGVCCMILAIRSWPSLFTLFLRKSAKPDPQ